jgi:hypothetical protein
MEKDSPLLDLFEALKSGGIKLGRSFRVFEVPSFIMGDMGSQPLSSHLDFLRRYLSM